MAGELGDMYDAAKDYVGDLAHHAYDAVKGRLSSPSAPSKPAYSSQPAGTVASGRVGQDFDNKIDQAVKDAGG